VIDLNFSSLSTYFEFTGFHALGIALPFRAETE